MMKQKVIDVHYRKDSNTFPEWMKYEITLLNEDGTEEKIPAYGKDLQDSLSRVVHDQKVERVEKKMERAPGWVWLATWISYMGAVSSLAVEYSSPLILAGGLSVAVVAGLYMQWWFRNRNIDKG
jgi:hypothetical protein